MGISKSSNFDFSDYNAAVEQAVKALAILTSSIRMCWIRHFLSWLGFYVVSVFLIAFPK